MRGDVHRLSSGRRAKGREQQGARYAVVLQADYLPLGTLIVAPTTTSTVGVDFWPEIEVDGQRSFVVVEQLMAVDFNRVGTTVGRVGPEEQSRIDDRLREVLDL